MLYIESTVSSTRSYAIMDQDLCVAKIDMLYMIIMRSSWIRILMIIGRIMRSTDQRSEAQLLQKCICYVMGFSLML
jgi:hypothetical protein